jgi:type III restriction enzyme
VAKVRQEVFSWRAGGYAEASATSKALLHHWFETEHLIEQADGSLSPFRYYFAQREAVETVIWLFEVRRARQIRSASVRRVGRGLLRHVR